MKQMLNRTFAALRDIYTYRYFHDMDKAPRYRGVYPSFAAAENAIPKGRPGGFNLDAVPAFFAEKQLMFNQHDYPVLFWLSQTLKPGVRVFDLGGGIGQCFYCYQQFLRFPEGLQWKVCDVESFMSRGPEHAKEQKVTNLSFTTDRHAADGCFFYLTNGAIHYIEPDLPEILGELTLKPRHVLVNRVPMYEGETYFTVQASSHSYVAHKVNNISRFVNEMEALGYETIDRWELPRTLHVSFHPERFVSNFRGFYFRLRDELLQPA